MPFKPRGTGKSPEDLMGLLVNSRMQTENNALYQTIFGLISITSALKKRSEVVQAQAVTIDREEEPPAFFFMGSS